MTSVLNLHQDTRKTLPTKRGPYLHTAYIMMIDDTLSFYLLYDPFRIPGLRWHRGGNASNNCTAMAKLLEREKLLGQSSNYEVEYFGVCSNDLPGE